jgi:hypothetical protein
VTVRVRAIYIRRDVFTRPLQPDTEWNEEIRTCVVTDVSRGLLNNASMFATEVILFVIILSGVYQRNSGRHILSTIYREVRGLC